MEKIVVYTALAFVALAGLSLLTYGLAMVWCLYEVITHLLAIL